MQQEQLDTQSISGNASEDGNSSSYLIKREPVPGTQFYAIQGSDGNCFLAMGKHKISREWVTEGNLLEEANNVLENDHWTIHMNVCVLLAEIVYKSNQE